VADPVSLGKGVTHNLDVKCGEVMEDTVWRKLAFREKTDVVRRKHGERLGFGTPVVRAVTSRYSVIS